MYVLYDMLEIVVYWYSFSNPRTMCIHYGFSLLIARGPNVFRFFFSVLCVSSLLVGAQPGGLSVAIHHRAAVHHLNGFLRRILHAHVPLVKRGLGLCPLCASARADSLSKFSVRMRMSKGVACGECALMPSARAVMCALPCRRGTSGGSSSP